MFHAGEYVVDGFSGICKVEEMKELCMPGGVKARKYYALIPLQSDGSVVYSPVESDKAAIRRVMTAEEAESLIDSIPDIEPLEITNDKYREEQYKSAMKTCDSREWIRIIKTLWLRGKERSRKGKQSTSVDSRYLKAAEDYLYTELSVALGKEKESMEAYITNRIRTMEQESCAE